MTIFIFNIILNSLLTFLTIALIVTSFLWMARIKSYRFKAFCLCLPSIKLGYDLLFGYQFSHWALAQDLNPLDMPEGSRLLSLAAGLNFPTMLNVGFSLQSGETFTLADCIALWMGSSTIFYIAAGWTALTTLSVSRWVYSIWQSNQFFKQLVSSSKICFRTVSNRKLKAKIDQYGIKIYASDEVRSPCVMGIRHPTMFFPSSLVAQLTQQEFEAIIAHELAHIQWYDTLVKAALSLFKAVFWWIPLTWLHHKIELYQEQACDQSTLQYGIRSASMAEALYKSSHYLLLENHITVNFVRSWGLKKRLVLLVHPPRKDHEILTAIKGFFMTLLALTLLTGKIWTF